MPVATDGLVRDLERGVPHGTVHRRGEDEAPGMWNAINGPPLVRVECRSVDDVRAAVRVAAASDRALYVWAGRHDVHARNAATDGIVVDLRHLREVRPHDDGTVTVQGGTTVETALAALPEDRVVVTTSNPWVGLVGAAAGGGYGPLVPRYGLVADQLVAAEVVTADGSTIRADASSDAELLWGLRGGGSGFGVVTEARFSTHPLGLVHDVTIAVPMSGAASALLLTRDLLHDEPDDLCVVPLFITTSETGQVLVLSAHWTGEDRDRGDRVARALLGLSGTVVMADQHVPYARSFSPAEHDLWPAGQQWQGDTCTIPEIEDDTAETLVECARTAPGSTSVVLLHDFHGAATRIDPASAAFPLRRPHYVVDLCDRAALGDDAAVARQREWIDTGLTKLASVALPGGYTNFLRPEDTARAEQAFGEATPRLQRLKDRLDPAGLFAGGLGPTATDGRRRTR